MKKFVYDIPVKACFRENQLQHSGTELIKYDKQVLLACDALVWQSMALILKMRLERREVV